MLYITNDLIRSVRLPKIDPDELSFNILHLLLSIKFTLSAFTKSRVDLHHGIIQQDSSRDRVRPWYWPRCVRPPPSKCHTLLRDIFSIQYLKHLSLVSKFHLLISSTTMSK